MKDVEESTALEQNHNLVSQPITFQGSCNSLENSTIKNKIDELRVKIGEYYFDKNNKLIAIPNQINLPNKPFILNPEETDKRKKRVNEAYIDEDCENKFHLEIVKVARNMNEHAFVMKGFHSENCLKVKIQKAKSMRTEAKCTCKAKDECTCGKEKYPELNANEKNIMDILSIDNIEQESLERCTELFHNMKLTETENSEEMTNDISKTEKNSANIKREKLDCPDVRFFNKE